MRGRRGSSHAASATAKIICRWVTTTSSFRWSNDGQRAPPIIENSSSGPRLAKRDDADERRRARQLERKTKRRAPRSASTSRCVRGEGPGVQAGEVAGRSAARPCRGIVRSASTKASRRPSTVSARSFTSWFDRRLTSVERLRALWARATPRARGLVRRVRQRGVLTRPALAGRGPRGRAGGPERKRPPGRSSTEWWRGDCDVARHQHEVDHPPSRCPEAGPRRVGACGRRAKPNGRRRRGGPHRRARSVRVA